MMNMAEAHTEAPTEAHTQASAVMITEEDSTNKKITISTPTLYNYFKKVEKQFIDSP